MTPALALIIKLQNAVVVCREHRLQVAPTIYERGFEQCAYLVPEAQKRIDAFYVLPTEAQQNVIDKAIVAKAIATLAAQKESK